MSEVLNPWLPDNWNLTAQGEYIKKYGVSVAQRKARQAGTTLGALEAKPQRPIVQNFFIKRVTNVAPAGGKGYSGTGAPP